MEEWRGALEERRRPRSRAAPGGGRGAVPWGLEDKLHVEEDGQGDGFTGLPDGWPASAAHRSGPHPDVPQDVVVEPAQAQTPTRIPSIPTTAIKRVSTNASSTTGPIREERLSGGASSQAQLTMSSASTDDLKGGEDRVLLEGQFKVKELGGWARWLWFSKYLTLTPRTLTVSKRAGGSAQRQMSLHAVIHVTRVENKKCCLLVDVAIGRPLLISFESDRELYAWQDAIYDHSLTSGVGMPTNFVHNIHVGFDPVNGAFTGLPDHWNKLLKTNALVPEEHVRRSQVISQEQAKHLTQSINNHSLSKSRSSAVHDQEAAEPSSVVNSTSTSSSNSSSHVRRRTTVRSGVEMVNTDTLLSTSSTLINH
ncbi:hypothetical protein AX16_005171 [Volvariella volvacea WC 439]|nr:hypothetical protein AX16_005171 [Volvariella volvacea WC 439]